MRLRRSAASASEPSAVDGAREGDDDDDEDDGDGDDGLLSGMALLAARPGDPEPTLLPLLPAPPPPVAPELLSAAHWPK